MFARHLRSFAVLVFVACGSPPPEDSGPPDLGLLALDQGRRDLGVPDLGLDAGPDAGPDEGPDFGVDAGPEPFPFAMCRLAPNPRAEDCADRCGNGRLDDGPVAGSCRRRFGAQGEACDGNEFGTETCESLGYSGGRLRCNAACAIDVAGCTGRCGAFVGSSGCGILRRASVAPDDLAAAYAADRAWVAHLENGGAWLTRIDPDDLDRQDGVGCLEVGIDSLELVAFDDGVAMAMHTVDGRVELFSVDGDGFNEGPLMDARRGSHVALAEHPTGLVLAVVETFGLRVLLIADDGSITWNRFIAGAIETTAEAPVAVVSTGDDILLAAVGDLSALRAYPISAGGVVGRASTVAETATRVELFPRIGGGAWIRYDTVFQDRIDVLAVDGTRTEGILRPESDVSVGTLDAGVAFIAVESALSYGELQTWRDDASFGASVDIWEDARRPVQAALADVPGDDILIAVTASSRYVAGAVDASSIVGGVVLARIPLVTD